MDDVHYLLSLGFSKMKISEILGVTRQTLYNKMKQSSVSGEFQKYTNITDSQLDDVLKEIKAQHLTDGEVMMAGHLISKGIRVQRAHLRSSLHRIDPEGIADRRSIAVKRRVYQVGRPNEVWHLDGNHKLIKWRFVIHGGIDGYSRTITYLKCHSNNKADTVLGSFHEAVSKYGCPSKVRTYHGGENIDVWRMMLSQHGDMQNFAHDC